MRIFAVAAFVLLAGLPVAGAYAADAPAVAPTPFPEAFDDAGMHFTAPAPYRRIPLSPPVIDAETDKLTPVGGYIRNQGQQDERTIVIAMRAFSATSLEAWETTLENDLRTAIPDLFVSHKTKVNLKNGMPAFFLKLAHGEGFTSMQQYGYAVFDGQRGIWVSVSGRLGVIGEEDAKDTLKDLSVVLYPYRLR